METTEVEILLVEDNSADAELAISALRHNSIANKIHRVYDGAEALDFLFAEGEYGARKNGSQPKVVLLDLKLPKVDGLEVLRTIRADSRTHLLPVVILTSSREETDMITGYKLGVNSYIQKPVDFDQFRETVRELGLYWLVVNQPPPNGAREAA